MMVVFVVLFGVMEHMFMQLVLVMVSVHIRLMGVVLHLKILSMMVVFIMVFGVMEHMFMQLVLMMVSMHIRLMGLRLL